jgi:hypothetical protein
MDNGAILMRTIAILAMAYFCAVGQARSAESISYTYDALGRLSTVTITGGPANNVQQTYRYDAAGNRSQYDLTGATPKTPVTISISNNVANVSSVGVAFTVNISGTSPSGMVTFTENGVFLGSAWVMDGQATIIVEGLPNGVHTIAASYSGDGTHAPQTTMFNIRVQDLRWLPAVLEMLLD